MSEDYSGSSRQRYRRFVRDYKQQRLDAVAEAALAKKTALDRPSAADPDTSEGGTTPKGLLPGRRREFLRAYSRWLWPHRTAIGVVFALGLGAAGLQMVEPLFIRFIVDRILLNTGVDAAARLTSLQMAGAAFLGLVLLSHLVTMLRDYRQRLLNVRVMLSLRRSLFDRLLHLPLPKLWDMKTGGILSRITGDVDTTTGLLQMAIMSPAISIVRLLIAMVILLTLNWRLALTALGVIPGIMLVSFIAARRIRPIYRAIRRDMEQIDGRVGETFSGIRVVRAFGREMRELVDYMRGRHSVLRKELFAHRRELVIWGAWGLLVSGVNVVLFWYGGTLDLQGRATIGDLLAFQWYTFLLLNPVWQIVNTFSELQRSLAAMERVFEILDLPPDKPDRPDASEAPAIVDQPHDRARGFRVPRRQAGRARLQRRRCGRICRRARRSQRRRQDDRH